GGQEVIDLLGFYRAKRWGKKLPFTRFLGYPLLGMAVGPEGALPSFPFLLYLVDGLAVTGILMFSYSLNDYFDFLLEGDSNCVGELLRTGRLTRRQALPLILLPLLLLLPSFLLPLPSLLLLLLFLLLSALYPLPGVRISRRERLKFLSSPFSALLLTLQALLLSGPPSPPGWGLLLLVLLFHYFVNSFYSLEKGWRGRRFLPLFPTLSLLLSLPLLLLSPFFLLTTLFSSLRLWSLGRMGGDFQALRSRLVGPPLFSEELLGYLLLGLAGVL
ncbi:MAG: hypothetical protein NQU48_00065, partial [Hadesarchaea archaeon]|nr:hypothetical protein [Hadesarchaea archaeon]